MGYDLPAAIGASLASRGKPSRVTCVTGDGSLMMNLQELATVCYLNLPIKLFILDNGGYHSIEETQQRNFPENIGGTGPKNGLGFPNFLDIAKAFGLKASQLNTINDVETCLRSKNFLDDKPCVFLVKLDKHQNFEPKLQSKRLADGSMVSPELHDMAPFLSKEDLKRNLIKD
jgi:acetolactate synthase-1/2/3 large subunit